jgi:cyclopropane fatty-acyl-phospholipid synthase-like methyltransferase
MSAEARIRLPEPDPSIHPVGREHGGRTAQLQLDLLRHFGLDEHTTLLEIGCGIGRLAQRLANVITEGSYIGFDIAPRAIEWLQTHYEPMLPNFQFDLIEARNDRYNRWGNTPADVIRFPYEPQSFGMACSFSVFTHMRLSEIAHYLVELHRVLTPSGIGIMTFFLIRDEDEHPRLQRGTQFVQIEEGVYTISPELPERGIAFNEHLVQEAIADANLRITEYIRGYWRGGKQRERPQFHKDVLALARA